jgi:hypothetical protein
MPLVTLVDYRNLPNQYDLLMLDIISIKRLKAKYAHVSATVQVVRPIYVMHINQSSIISLSDTSEIQPQTKQEGRFI